MTYVNTYLTFSTITVNEPREPADRGDDIDTIAPDVLFDFVSKRVIKFVLHTNAPGHCDFGIYSRCNFSILLKDNQYEICTDSKFDEFSHEFMGDSSSPRPVVLSRHEQQPFGSSFCYGTKQIIVEVMENGFLSSLSIYDGSKDK
ncbi:hypothetical protein L3Y34_014589 [Caenorhabditis briggsae]|uniref:Uncharacterized protein n=1 Tax=Caenorhabditis briggsae TaxID=6238 RepID=A0AAE9DS99_CAEBR|nr:hypothetical protein L3Y34_014589 [Caenorhabditis briggsae]